MKPIVDEVDNAKQRAVGAVNAVKVGQLSLRTRALGTEPVCQSSSCLTFHGVTK